MTSFNNLGHEMVTVWSPSTWSPIFKRQSACAQTYREYTIKE